MIKLYEKPDNPWSGKVLAIAIIVIMLLMTAKCHAADQARVDTMVCKVECIQKIVEMPTSNGKSTKLYAVYNDTKAGFSEIIPISKNVADYINMCKQYSVQPTLGIKLRNGVISSIVRYKIKFQLKK